MRDDRIASRSTRRAYDLSGNRKYRNHKECGDWADPIGSERNVLHGRNSRRRRKGGNGRSTILRGEGRCRRNERSGCGTHGNAFGKRVDANDKQRQRNQRKHGHNAVFIAIPRRADDIRQRANQRDRARIYQRDQQKRGHQRDHVTQTIVAARSRWFGRCG